MQVELAANGVKDDFYQEVPPTWDLILYVPSTIFSYVGTGLPGLNQH